MMADRSVKNQAADDTALVKRNQRRSKRALVIGVLFAVFLLICLSDEELRTTYLGMILIVAIVLLVCIYIYIDTMRFDGFRERAKTYISAVEHSKHNQLSEVAEKLDLTEKEIRKELDRLQKRELIGQVLIDADGEIQLLDRQGHSLVTTVHEKEAQREALLYKYKNVVCPACGAANNPTPGKKLVCAYCGTELDNPDAV